MISWLNFKLNDFTVYNSWTCLLKYDFYWNGIINIAFFCFQESIDLKFTLLRSSSGDDWTDAISLLSYIQQKHFGSFKLNFASIERDGVEKRRKEREGERDKEREGEEKREIDQSWCCVILLKLVQRILRHRPWRDSRFSVYRAAVLLHRRGSLTRYSRRKLCSLWPCDPANLFVPVPLFLAHTCNRNFDVIRWKKEKIKIRKTKMSTRKSKTRCSCLCFRRNWRSSRNIMLNSISSWSNKTFWKRIKKAIALLRTMSPSFFRLFRNTEISTSGFG